MQNSANSMNEIISLEKKYWTAMRDRDLETALALTDFPCLIAGEHGVQSVSREEFEEMFKAGGEQVRSFDFDEGKSEIRQVGPDTVVLAYKVHSVFLKDGKEQEIDAADASTWIRRNGKWQCAMHTEAKLH